MLSGDFDMMPWRDTRGRLSPRKLIVFSTLFLPAAWTLGALLVDGLGPRHVNEAIHQAGLWAIRFLAISLAVTPARQILHWPALALVRRMIGVAAFCYITLHF